MENPASLLRRLNPCCARAMEGAASLCQSRAHAAILPEHWLLKLLEQGEGDLTVMARRYEWDMDALWQDLLSWLDKQPRSVRHRPQLSGAILKLMQEAWLIASLSGEAQIRSVHLLMALVAKQNLIQCDGLWPLLTLGQSQLERLRPLLDTQSDERPQAQQEAALAQRHGGDVEFVGRPADGVPNADGPNPALQNALDKFTLDVTAKARDGQIDPVFGRDTEIRQMVDILSRRRKNNPILVGEPGVGKTALVEGLALRIAEGNVPDALKPVSVRTLDLGLLQAGAGVKGEFEQRLKNIIEAVQQSPTPVLLFIDEAHTIIGAGNQAGGADAANLLKPALARGELRTIAATTWREYKQYFERDAALERRFQMVKVDEPDDDTACLMLRGLKPRYAHHHGVHITDDAVRAAVTLSRRYLTGRQLPDKAVDLLDTASARLRMSLDTVPEPLTRLKAQLTALAMEKQALLEDIALGNSAHGERLAFIEQEENRLILALDTLETQYGQELQLTEALRACRRDLSRQGEINDLQNALTAAQHGNPLLGLDVDVRTVAMVIADWTGVPLSSLMKDEQTELLSLEQSLGKRVVGQEAALSAIARRLRAAKTGLTPENGPQGVFLLVGPSGTGKTETALALADALFGGEKALITINLSEYQEPHTVSQLKGSPPGYIGYGQGGILTEAVRKRPYSVVLLDEVEKAHRDVMNLFYQVFDRGVMRDGEGREIDFRNTVILMTANLGSDLLMQLLDAQPEASESDLHELLRPVLRGHFQPALLARFQTVIYRPLPAAALRAIVGMKLGQVSQRLACHYGMTTILSESLFDALTEACLLPDTGARNVDILLNQQILPALSQQLLSHMAAGHKPNHVTLGYHEEEGIVMAFDEGAIADE
ncbi:type VI secretion system ATPase TssH [Klebsiella quasipneumoniae]|uniref:Type VI secretion system ATPase TssH n=1 Tax=Klebsiella quasipneumoniae subsp. quasipneumoniae TaxID=1667327 RepID=A0AAW8XKB0_9ENTR|nr:type VI secretion system ATPase TssH [Klebsiella quasipneumoniae]ELT0942547.1 type VI secretion system ATPase TssH [Klebsiella quasipneumoniae]MBM5553747.1 type VI secretion system ATPase TssH [Klebsiella quasipneumoniae]MBM5559483.1 type VI secretion system ATPase TssH [Klebsiella quasipneumoniae]MCJ4449463.1 type VI secretion system ATPase TssH [Klebsiella quasipneumoniae]MDV0839976.1 type VI secretion system ATPase TssH [Klebsiella quasipneumoniae subsp. quasipneumoniae]